MVTPKNLNWVYDPKEQLYKASLPNGVLAIHFTNQTKTAVLDYLSGRKTVNRKILQAKSHLLVEAVFELNSSKGFELKSLNFTKALSNDLWTSSVSLINNAFTQLLSNHVTKLRKMITTKATLLAKLHAVNNGLSDFDQPDESSSKPAPKSSDTSKQKVESSNSDTSKSSSHTNKTSASATSQSSESTEPQPSSSSNEPKSSNGGSVNHSGDSDSKDPFSDLFSNPKPKSTSNSNNTSNSSASKPTKKSADSSSKSGSKIDMFAQHKSGSSNQGQLF